MKDKLIVLAAGEGTRWNNYLGTTKHLLKIDGESLLERIVRLFKDCDITIIGRDEGYKVDGAELHIPEFIKQHDVNQQTFHSQDFWNKEGRTIIILGDIFFSEECVKAILDYDGDDIRFYGREGKSNCNGCDWGELFAVSFKPEHRQEVIASLHKASQIIKSDGRLNDWWEFYRFLDGIDPMVHATGKRFVEVNDFTDDFDLPENYVTWQYHYDRHNNTK